MNRRMDQQGSTKYTFDGFRVDTVNRLVYAENGEILPLKAKAFDTLLYLVEHPGRVIERDEMLAAIWPDTAVEENNLTQHISTLRRLFGERPNEHKYIVTVPGHGYKFVPDVRSLASSDIPPSHAPSERQQEDSSENPAGRPWLFILAVFVLIGLSTLGFILWRENRVPASGAPVRSLAVLPFKPLVAGVRDESLELGMADSMIAKLSAGDVRVRPLAAVRRYNAVDQDPLAAGRELGVEAVLDGNIQILNDRVRISANLIRVSDGKQLWADQYNGVSADIFGLQDSISERVAAALRIALGERSRKKYTASVEAYQLFSKGKFHTSRLILPEVQKGISYYEQAIAVDPAYALAYVEIANACRALALTSDARPNDVMPKARAAARRATELDPALAEAPNALALAAFWYDFDPETAERFHLRALELDPQSAQAHFGYAHLLSNTGRHDEALAEIKRSREIDPVSLVTNALEG
ncbi:MAG TPA: winged helix-turn-helix domain-containing protein, partial [Pyrinomonadaceae bacterium]|nr:winged helix-turn-helix domain-containing protein [Pyrinomonadaceae bacterium]